MSATRWTFPAVTWPRSAATRSAAVVPSMLPSIETTVTAPLLSDRISMGLLLRRTPDEFLEHRESVSIAVGLVVEPIRDLLDQVPAEPARPAVGRRDVETRFRSVVRMKRRRVIRDRDRDLVAVAGESYRDGPGIPSFVAVDDEVAAGLVDRELQLEAHRLRRPGAAAGLFDEVAERRHVLDPRLAFDLDRAGPLRALQPAFLFWSSPSIFDTSLVYSTGFVSKSSHPAWRAFASSPAMACAVSAITGSVRVFGSLFSRRVASQPSSTGRLMSMRTTSGASLAARATPCAPSNASTTS